MFDINNTEAVKGNAQIIPGSGIKAKLVDLKVTESGDLDMTFEGTELDNNGTSTVRIWASVFDAADERYSQKKAQGFSQALKNLVEAFVPAAEIAKMPPATSATQYFTLIVGTVTPDKYKEVPVELVLMYRGNSDVYVTIPIFTPFIKSALCPGALNTVIALSSKKGDNGVPYNRFLPMSEYGATPSTVGGETAAPLAFGAAPSDEPTPAFGA
jgi:hypothetical protein